ncbi:hypothetical protein K470DRAFT_258757 [Piedraia hortae CBS 480.64]|uniref:Uncharacterized protein n=1 Tax=Piedraia hortae CBS 480.64 TaxID=1314780 RepID=A0A6A7BWH7_9PEZI|nr:hypothetical protein K470DRAFT_258757 [Piedraia hortae CBS 480.64]
MPPPRRRKAQNDPLAILTQIALLQLGFYAAAAVLITFSALAAGWKLSPDLFLDWRSVRTDAATGWTLALCWILVAGVILGMWACRWRELQPIEFGFGRAAEVEMSLLGNTGRESGGVEREGGG